MSAHVHARRLASVLAVSATVMGTALAIAPGAQASPASRSDDTAGVRGVVYTTLQHGDRIYIGGEFDFAGRWSGAGQVVDASGGRVAAPALRIVGQVNAAVPDGIGGWFIGGSFTQVLGAQRLGLARISKAGKISPFRADVAGTVNALAYSGGNLYVGGSFTGVGGASRTNLASVSAATNTVTGWNPGANGPVRALEMAPGNTAVYAGGSFSQVGGASRSNLAELTASNGSATAWNPGATGEVRAIESAGSTAYVGGDFSFAGGASRTDLAAIDASTGAATSWAPTTNGAVNALAVPAGGTNVVAGGTFSSVSGQPRQNLVGISADGAVLPWAADANGEVYDLESPPNGEVQVVGAFTSVDGSTRLRGASVTPSGDLGAWDPGTDEAIRAAAASTAKDATGSVVTKTMIGGTFSYVNGAARQNIAAIDVATGDVDRSFVADTDAIVKAVAMAPAGDKLFIGGAFTDVNGLFRSRLAALNPTTGAALTWSANAGGSVNALATNGDALYVGGGFGSIGGANIARLAKVSIGTSSVDSSFDPNPGAQVRALEVTSDGSKIFAVGGFGTMSGQSRPGAALVNANGTLGSWAPAEGGSAIAADLSPDQSRIYFSTSKNRMFAYDYSGANPNTPTWISRTGGDVQAIAATATEVYVGGHFRNFPDEHLARPHLASVYVTTGLATPWSPGANGSFGVWSITATADSLLIGGDFDRAGSRRQPGFARFSGTP